MLDKLLALVLGAKSGALPGILILAGTVATVATGTGVTTVTAAPLSPPPSAAASGTPTSSPLGRPPSPTPSARGEEQAPAPSASRVPVSCADLLRARDAARQAVQAAYARVRGQLERLRAVRPGARTAETTGTAGSMVEEIRAKTDQLLGDGQCGADREGVADRAIAAMETVFELAKSAASATPSPAPKPKPTARAKPPERVRHAPPKRDEHRRPEPTRSSERD